jgi:hypothetical protein
VKVESFSFFLLPVKSNVYFNSIAMRKIKFLILEKFNLETIKLNNKNVIIFNHLESISDFNLSFSIKINGALY